MSWRRQWLQLKQRMGIASDDDPKRPGEGRPSYSPFPFAEPEDEDAVLGDDDVALVRNPANLPGLTGVVVRQNGAIELFAGPQAGIRIDPSGAIALIGKHISLLSSGDIQLETAQNGLVWNGIAPFYKRALHGATTTAIPVTVLPHAPQETALSAVTSGVATSILVAKERVLSSDARSMWSWLVRSWQ